MRQSSGRTKVTHPLGDKPIVDFVTGKIGFEPVPMAKPGTTISTKVYGAMKWGYPEGVEVEFEWLDGKPFEVGKTYLIRSEKGVTFAACSDQGETFIEITRPDGSYEILPRADIIRAAGVRWLFIEPDFSEIVIRENANGEGGAT